ncbi:MAG TPA: DUF5701 family protein [Dermatophilaceae bacterium]|nr:DUF5701 family protein [Dermatophilaceae bacterium]
MSRSPLTETPDEARRPAGSAPSDASDPSDAGMLTVAQVDAEIARQVARIADSGQLVHAGWPFERLLEAAERLRPGLVEAAVGLPQPDRERVPFVLVLPPGEVPPSIAATTLRLGHRTGFVSADTSDIDAFRPVDGVTVPEGLYAIVDVRRGSDHRGRTPESALDHIGAEGRSPLTISEGLALLTAHPDCLEKNHCFQTPGSRAGDRRVPGLWISGGAPKLGFCWAGNHHSWLGVASCGSRLPAA